MEARRAARLLQDHLNDRNSIGKPYAMQGLTNLALQHPNLRPLVAELVGSLICTGTSSMRTRGSRLLTLLAERASANRPAQAV